MQCPKCGNTAIKPNQKFCTKCGQPLNVATIPSSSDQAGQKGFIDNVSHLGTFMERGSRGVEQEVLHERQERARQQAEAGGLIVSTESVATPSQEDSRPSAESSNNRLRIDTTSVEGISLVNGRAIWNIQKGEVARLITETEFANADGLKGIIIQEGCSALVYVDGELVSMMQAGCYTFPAKTTMERKFDDRQREMDAEEKEVEAQRKEDESSAQTFASRGIFGSMAAFGRGVMNFLFGKKEGESKERHTARVQRTREKLNSIPSPKVCRVYVVSNRVMNVCFGMKQDAEDNLAFAPFSIATKFVDVQIAVSMQLQVTNMLQFVTNYLADKRTVVVADFVRKLTPVVQNAVGQLLRNFEYQQEGLPEAIVNNLKSRVLQIINENLQGVECVKVMDITDRSDDFEHFRSVERELFISEHELDFLHRTGEMRNRLEQEKNQQTIRVACNAEELRQALQEVNKDKLLSEDEMEAFVQNLESQRRIREAKTKEEEYEALLGLKKNRLVADDDVAALENTLAQGVISRESVTEILRVQELQKLNMTRQIAEFELSDSKMEHDMANALRQAQHQGNLVAVQLDSKRLFDAYNDERKEFDWNFAQRQREADNQQLLFEQQMRERQAQVEHERARQNKYDDMDLLERKARIAQQNMQAMKEAELAAQREQNRSAENLASMQHSEQMNRDNNFANMSADQIRAAQLSHLSGDAQVAMAQSYGSAQQQADQKALYEQMLAQQQAQNAQSQQMMMQMAQMMQQGMMGAAGVQQQRADEYRQQAQDAQQRQEQAQNTAMNSMSQVATAAASNLYTQNANMNIQQNVTVADSGKHCPNCGASVADGEEFCMECGTRIA